MNPILAGLQIFAIYDPYFQTGAEHDEFFVYGFKTEISKEDAEILDKLGWRMGDGGWSITT